MPFDLDDEELKATRKLNGADKEQYKSIKEFCNINPLKELWNIKNDKKKIIRRESRNNAMD